ncbi:MAG: DNA primase [Planctomycetales bacterium]|nr:DNA primase [Planctomycetales bacterium]
MYTGSEEVKERIRQAVDLVDYVGEHLELRRQGRNFVALCPWHNDSRPSLQINPVRQSWKCWVCDLGGDIFSFVMQRERVGFREALEILADKAGIVLETTASHPVEPGSPEDKATLYKAMQWAADQYHQCLLKSSEGAAGRDYLANRGITQESIERYRIGFVPDGWQWLMEKATGTPFSAEVLSAVGLAVNSEKTGRWFDRFRGRVMFPICDVQGRAIAIGGRILPELADEKTAKYINSPETRLFSKSEQLYGLNLAKDALSRERNILVMEGYTDVVIASQYGVNNAVAVLGTALGPRHLPVLRRFADRVTLLLDGDAAGQRRSSEILELFIANPIDLRIVTLPGNLDPCDFLLEHGRDALEQQVESAPDVWEYKIRLETQGVDLVEDTHQANRALENLLTTIAKAPRPDAADLSSLELREQQILNRLALDFQLNEKQLRARIADLRRKPQPAVAAPPPPPAPIKSTKPHLESIERDLFELLLQHPTGIGMALEEIHVTQLKTPTARQLFQTLEELLERHASPDFNIILTTIEDIGLKSLLVELDETGQKKQDTDRELALRELLQTFQRRWTEEQLSRDQAALEASQLDEQQEMDVLMRIFRTRQELQ